MLLERSEHANSNMAAGVVNGRRDNFTGLVRDQFHLDLGKFRSQEVPWVPGGSGPSSWPYSAECVEGEFSEGQRSNLRPRPVELRLLVQPYPYRLGTQKPFWGLAHLR
jgi:hypothetical protein